MCLIIILLLSVYTQASAFTIVSLIITCYLLIFNKNNKNLSDSLKYWDGYFFNLTFNNYKY